MKIRPATKEDIPELVIMYRELLNIAYPRRKIANKKKLEELVTLWFDGDIINVVYNDKELVGFTLITITNAGGATETILDAEISFVKAEYRKSRAAYLLYEEGLRFAVFMGMGVMTTSNPDSAPIMKKRYGSELTFSHFEVSTEYIKKLKK